MRFLSFCHEEHEQHEAREAEPGRGQVESGQTRKAPATVCIVWARECWSVTTAIADGLRANPRMCRAPAIGSLEQLLPELLTVTSKLDRLGDLRGLPSC